MNFRPRFTTRLLLVFMVLFGAMLVPVIWRLERAKKQKEVVEEILENGGTVTYSWEGSGSPPMDTKLRQLLGKEFFDEVTEVHDTNYFVVSLIPGDDALKAIEDRRDHELDLTRLAVLTRLRVLDLAGTSHDDISPLVGNKNLETLKLEYSSVEDIGPLGKLPNLVDLDISHSLVRDISPLKECKKLRRLRISGLQIEDYSPLKDLPKLERVAVSNETEKQRVHDLVPHVTVYVW